jgi:hypothetical protein
MEHSYRWKTRLTLGVLESRMQPGSILTSGIDLSGIGEVVAPQQPDTRPDRVIKKVEDTQELAIVGAKKNDAATTTNLTTSAPDTNSQPTSSLGLQSPAVTPKLMNPAITAPTRVETPIPIVPQAGNTGGTRDSFQKVQKPIDSMQKDALTASPETGHAAPTGDRVTVTYHDPSQYVTVIPCDDPGSRVFTPEWATHTDQGAATATNNAVESGKGADIGGAYFAGSQGTSGTVMKVGATGGCVYTIVVAPIGGEAIVFNGLDVIGGATSNVYAVGNKGADDSVAMRADPVTGTVTALVTFDIADPGGIVRMNGVGQTDATAPVAAKDVGISGSLTDPAGLGDGASRLWAVNMSAGLGATNYSTIVTFTVGGVPVPAAGLDVDVGRFAAPPTHPSHESYHVGYIDEAGVSKRNLTMRLDHDGLTIPWAFTLGIGGVHTTKAANAMTSANYIAGSGAPGTGLRTAGSYECLTCTTPNPGFDSAIIANWTPATGTPLLWGWVWSATGFDFSLQDVTTVRATGEIYTADYFGVPGDEEAGGDVFDSTGGVFVDGYSYVGAGTDEFGTGVDIVPPGVGLPRDHLLSANVGGDLGTVTGLECDTTYNGGLSGWGASTTQT